LAAAAAVAAIKMIDQEGLLAKADKLGKYAMTRLGELKAKHDFISQLRGRGLMIGIELDIPGADLVSACLEKGLRINCTQETVLRFMPAATATKQQIDEAIDILAAVLAECSPAAHSLSGADQ
jgi:acetylornithine/succinyldiaminopimelate/putrescine aminotransferase